MILSLTLTYVPLTFSISDLLIFLSYSCSYSYSYSSYSYSHSHSCPLHSFYHFFALISCTVINDPTLQVEESSIVEKEEKFVDTSWFLTKEDIVRYLEDPERNVQKELRPTDAIFRNGRAHRGFTIIKKVVANPDVKCTSILEESSESTMGRGADVLGSTAIKPDDSFFTLPKPDMPGPVLTYKQLSDIYDRPSISYSLNLPDMKSPKTASTAPATASTSPSSRSRCSERSSRGTTVREENFNASQVRSKRREFSSSNRMLLDAARPTHSPSLDENPTIGRYKYFSSIRIMMITY